MSDSGDQAATVINKIPQELRDDVVVKIALIGDAQISKVEHVLVKLLALKDPRHIFLFRLVKQL